MTDSDARAIRALVEKYGLRAVVHEVTRITAAYAAVSPKYHPAKAALGRLWYAMKLTGKSPEDICTRFRERPRVNT